MILTPHFSLGEAACKDGTPLPAGLCFNALRVAEAAETVRATWNLPMTVRSWYRTPAWNLHEKGAEDSMHLWALAMDLEPPDGVDLLDFWTRICDLAAITTIRGIGYAGPQQGRFVHLDCRPGSVIHQWRYPVSRKAQLVT
jgi:uncharacterized protein YcbK (DUF882 family)